LNRAHESLGNVNLEGSGDELSVAKACEGDDIIDVIVTRLRHGCCCLQPLFGLLRVPPVGLSVGSKKSWSFEIARERTV
jgi:hypothetical protein